MKKLAIALTFFCLSTVSFADKTIRIINSDSQPIDITYKVCSEIHFKTGGEMKVICSTANTVKLQNLKEGSKEHYKDITFAEDSEDDNATNTTFFHVDSAKAVRSGAISNFAADMKNCSVDITHDVILLNSFQTDRILCNDRYRDGESD